jgi:hypothetical protein
MTVILPDKRRYCATDPSFKQDLRTEEQRNRERGTDNVKVMSKTGAYNSPVTMFYPSNPIEMVMLDS